MKGEDLIAWENHRKCGMAHAGQTRGDVGEIGRGARPHSAPTSLHRGISAAPPRHCAVARVRGCYLPYHLMITPPSPPALPLPRSPLFHLSLSLALRSPPAGRAFVGTRACVCREARKCVHTNTRWRDRLTFRARQKYAPPRGPRINRSLWLFCRRAGMRARTHVSLSHTHYDAYISLDRARLCVACACVLPSTRHATVTYLSRPRRQCRLCAARGDRSGSTCAQPAAQRWCWRPCRTR